MVLSGPRHLRDVVSVRDRPMFRQGGKDNGRMDTQPAGNVARQSAQGVNLPPDLGSVYRHRHRHIEISWTGGILNRICQQVLYHVL
jgi:hypothetical protein